jgi:predicted small metal-binding protein
MRVIDCECGHTLQAANDEDLLRVARQHMQEEHGDQEVNEDQLQGLIARAYTAMDA